MMSDYPALPAFAVALVALFLKTTLTSMLQIIGRFRTRTFVLPEDAAMMRMRPKEQESAFVQRCANVWRNDVENLPLFIALALTYVLFGAPLASAQMLFTAYVVLRYAHTGVFLFGVQPWRVIMYYGSLAICWVIAVRIVMLAVA